MQINYLRLTCGFNYVIVMLVSRGQTAFFFCVFPYPNTKEKSGLATRDYCYATFKEVDIVLLW